MKRKRNELDVAFIFVSPLGTGRSELSKNMQETQRICNSTSNSSCSSLHHKEM